MWEKSTIDVIDLFCLGVSLIVTVLLVAFLIWAIKYEPPKLPCSIHKDTMHEVCSQNTEVCETMQKVYINCLRENEVI